MPHTTITTLSTTGAEIGDNLLAAVQAMAHVAIAGANANAAALKAMADAMRPAMVQHNQVTSGEPAKK